MAEIFKKQLEITEGPTTDDNKEVKISTLLAGNSLKDGKIGDTTRALEEKMRAEQNKKSTKSRTR